VAQFPDAPAAALLLAVLPEAAAELLEELELLLHPAASKIDPTVAAVATIAFDARKVKTLPCRPGEMGASLGILARQVHMVATEI